MGGVAVADKYDVVVVGGGIVGLATAHAVLRTGRRVVVVEREPRLAAHQTGRNSNVIHSGKATPDKDVVFFTCKEASHSLQGIKAA